VDKAISQRFVERRGRPGPVSYIFTSQDSSQQPIGTNKGQRGAKFHSVAVSRILLLQGFSLQHHCDSIAGGACCICWRKSTREQLLQLEKSPRIILAASSVHSSQNIAVACITEYGLCAANSPTGEQSGGLVRQAGSDELPGHD